jgi:two-component system, NtrC family, response regulator AtoC
MIPDETLRLMREYHFPGNIRELQSLIFDAVSRSDNWELEPAFFRSYIKSQELVGRGQSNTLASMEGTPTMQTIQDFYIAQALNSTGWNQTIAAKSLKISQATISRWVKKHGKPK